MNVSNEETNQEASLVLYKEQLSQVNQAIELTGETTDLLQLKNDLSELIALTEENLLQLKKDRLLKSLEESCTEADQENGQDDPFADEYAAFQASLSTSSNTEQAKVPPPISSPPPLSSSSLLTSARKSTDYPNTHVLSTPTAADKFDNNSNSSSSSDEEDSGDELDTSLTHMIGTKCQAPIKNDWGRYHYGNAMIWSVQAPSESTHSSEYMLQVIFLNPTQPSMVPCSYYMNGSCRFSSDSCRRSHGQAVLVSELKPYLEPDHSKICEGCRCLARWSDEVWYPGEVVDVCDDHQVNIKFDAGGIEETILVEHILPLNHDEDTSSDDDDDDDLDKDVSPSTSDDKHTIDQKEAEEDDDGGLPVYLWKPSGTTDRLGAWEDHTRGVGSRLMAKMGYITGQGLGKNGDGRAEPVPIMLLPQGKSLDKIMELKEMAGNADLFNAMKKMEKRQKILEKKEAEKEKRREDKSNRGVFGFLNKELHSKTGDKTGSGPAHHARLAHSSKHKVAESTTTSARELKKRSDKDVNIQIFKTAEEIRGVERNLMHLRKQLARNESRDRKMAEQVKQKITEQESYLQQLKTSSQTLESHKQSRSAHKKLTIF